MLSYEEQHQLLTKCFKISSIKQMGGASGRTCLPLIGVTLSYPTNDGSQISFKMIGFVIYPQYRKCTAALNSETSIAYEVLRDLFRCINQMGSASDSIYK